MINWNNSHSAIAKFILNSSKKRSLEEEASCEYSDKEQKDLEPN
jgi:hypothetical protein